MRFSLACVCVGLAIPLAAQEDAPIGIIRGDLLAWSGTPKRGELTFRNAQNRVFQCTFDEHTYFERAHERISLSPGDKGDHIEVLSDRKDGTGICYARTVEVLDGLPMRPAARPRTEVFAPRGDMTVTGVVLKVSPERMILRTRSNERRMILLRADTRFSCDGQVRDQASLAPNMRVFVRAGRNYEEEVEAYQVIWGEILEPVRPVGN